MACKLKALKSKKERKKTKESKKERIERLGALAYMTWAHILQVGSITLDIGVQIRKHMNQV